MTIQRTEVNAFMESIPIVPAIQLHFCKNDKEECTSLGRTLKILAPVLTNACTTNKPINIGICYHTKITENTLSRRAHKLLEVGCLGLIIISENGKDDNPWSNAIFCGSISSRLIFCQPNIQSLLCGIRGLATILNECTKTDPYLGRLQATLEADALLRITESYSHGSKNDIANRILAPLRMLAKATPPDLVKIKQFMDESDRRRLIEEFNSELVKKIESNSVVYGCLGLDMREAVSALHKIWSTQPDLNTIAQVTSDLMAIITECRVLAGAKTKTTSPKNSSSSESDKIKSDSETFKLLVVDDNWDDWEPVFDEITKSLKSLGYIIEIDHSNDGKNVQGRDLLAAVPEFDVVLLDIFINGVDGRDLLNNIRENYQSVPVLIWTTSRDQEITHKSPLANGFILKKTSTISEICSTLLPWFEEGRNRRIVSLPSPFFDHVIKDGEHRTLVRDMTEWCLKQMDGFHGLDAIYFRNFTDHGGRHFVKLISLLDHALRPLLGDLTVFSESAEERKTDYLALYLSIICHELGMFPMRIKNEIEDFGNAKQAFLEGVRIFHAPRGMYLIGDDSHSHWLDSEGVALACRLDKLSKNSKLRHHLALLVGHHARFFKSLKSLDGFKATNNEKGDAFQRKIKKAPELDDITRLFDFPVTESGRLVEEYIAFYKKLIENYGNDELDRIRKQCAIIRFVDAIDISKSRNPSEYLLLDWKKRSAKHLCEVLKRQLCEDIEISVGIVNASITADSPTLEILQKVVGSLNVNICNDEILKPWASEYQNENGLKELSPRRYYDDLDEFLLKFWKVIINDTFPEMFDFHKQLMQMNIINNDRKITHSGAGIVSSVAGICIAGEVLDEYEAIIDVKLEDKLKLGSFKWVPFKMPEIFKPLLEGNS